MELIPRDYKLCLREQMSQDIEELLTPYKNKDIGIRILAEKTEISEKTLKRVLKSESDPHTVTVHRFYEHYFKVHPHLDDLKEVHQKLKAEIESHVQENKQKVAKDLEKLLASNKVFRDIFLFSHTGPITKAWVTDRFGSYGMDVVSQMIHEDLLVEKEKNVYVEGPLSISKGPETLKAVILDMIDGHMRTELLQEYGHNMAFYSIEGVTDQAFDEALELTEQFKKSIAQLLARPESKGNRRLFATCVVDQLQELDKKGRLH